MGEQLDKIRTCSFAISESNKQKLDRIYSELGSPTWNETFTNLVERFYDPIKKNEEVSNRADKLATDNKELQEQYKTLLQKNNDLQSDLDSMVERYSKLSIEYEDYKNREQEKLSGDAVILHIDKINQRVLKEVAKRESITRKQSWSIDDIVNYFIDARFVRGMLNGGLSSLPDSLVKEIKKQEKEASHE